jgi:hypothetical protein
MTLNKQTERFTARTLLAGGAVGFALALGATATPANSIEDCSAFNGDSLCEELTISAEVPTSCELAGFDTSDLTMSVADGQLSGSSTTSTLTCNTATDIQLVSVNGRMQHSVHDEAPFAAENTLLSGSEFTSYFDYTASVSGGGSELFSLDTASVDPGQAPGLEEAYGVDTATASTTLTLTVTPQQPSATLQSGTYEDTLIVVIAPR